VDQRGGGEGGGEGERGREGGREEGGGGAASSLVLKEYRGYFSGGQAARASC